MWTVQAQPPGTRHPRLEKPVASTFTFSSIKHLSGLESYSSEHASGRFLFFLQSDRARLCMVCAGADGVQEFVGAVADAATAAATQHEDNKCHVVDSALAAAAIQQLRPPVAATRLREPLVHSGPGYLPCSGP